MPACAARWRRDSGAYMFHLFGRDRCDVPWGVPRLGAYLGTSASSAHLRWSAPGRGLPSFGSFDADSLCNKACKEQLELQARACNC
eukprot:2682230-Pyramimonas_sp.AAC.1